MEAMLNNSHHASLEGFLRMRRRNLNRPDNGCDKVESVNCMPFAHFLEMSANIWKSFGVAGASAVHVACAVAWRESASLTVC